jgi:hypothetical protein
VRILRIDHEAPRDDLSGVRLVRRQGVDSTEGCQLPDECRLGWRGHVDYADQVATADECEAVAVRCYRCLLIGASRPTDAQSGTGRKSESVIAERWMSLP